MAAVLTYLVKPEPQKQHDTKRAPIPGAMKVASEPKGESVNLVQTRCCQSCTSNAWRSVADRCYLT
jgi:hypothetical protein